LVEGGSDVVKVGQEICIVVDSPEKVKAFAKYESGKSKETRTQ